MRITAYITDSNKIKNGIMRNNFIRKTIFKVNACLSPRHCGTESYEP